MTVFVGHLFYRVNGIPLRFVYVEISEVRKKPSEKPVAFVVFDLPPRIFFRSQSNGLLNHRKRSEGIEKNREIQSGKNYDSTEAESAIGRGGIRKGKGRKAPPSHK